MAEYTKQELTEKFQKLPSDLQGAIFSVDVSEAIIEIGKNHKLLIDKVGELADETGLVLFGLTHPKDFISNLEKRLGVPRQTAKNIAEEVNKKIFFKVRESLRNIHGLHEKTEETKEEKEETKEISEKPSAIIPRLKPEMRVEEIKKPVPAPIAPIAPEPRIEMPAPLPAPVSRAEEIKPPAPDFKEQEKIPAGPKPPPELPVQPEPNAPEQPKDLKTPPIFSPKTEGKVFTSPPKTSDENHLLETTDQSFQERPAESEDKTASITQKEAAEYMGEQDPYREPLE